MSESHIPQPDTGAAPAEQFGSTEAAPTGRTVSAIGVPGPPPQEVPVHTLAQNRVDPTLYEQFLYNSTFTWSTSDQPGKLLWSMPVTPLAYNKITARLATIYNAWGGGVDVNVKIAGTGFHAGALVVVRIPPNYSPEDFAGSFDFTAFEYVVFDPKMLEVMSMHIGDQRQINYHYVNAESESPESWDIGGHVAVYVQMALNTASTGTQQIQATVWTRLAQDFTFSQLRMPRQITDQKTDQIPTVLLSALNLTCGTSFRPRCCSIDARASVLRILPNSIKLYDNTTFNAYKLDGTTLWLTPSRTTSDTRPYYTCMGNFTTPKTLTMSLGFYGVLASDLVCIQNLTSEDAQQWLDVKITEMTAGARGFTCVMDAPPGDKWKNGDTVAVTVATNEKARYNNPLKCTTPAPIALPLDESFVCFTRFTDDTVTSLQTMEVSDIFRCELYGDWLPEGKAALFNVVDTSVQLPIMQVKLYPNGVFATAPSTNQVDFAVKNLRFDFLQFTEITNPLKNPPAIALNALMMAPIHKKELRRAERKIE
uniref:Calicivirus coat protein domain-containing protein n=1 Tax=Picornavirales sp. TaxID=1955153 RepID=A0A6M3YP74_9VIRU|nr:MAG: hypothetical protein 2 [Picornavirales sp.]